jgi:hypothetical protein
LKLLVLFYCVKLGEAATSTAQLLQKAGTKKHKPFTLRTFPHCNIAVADAMAKIVPRQVALALGF